MPGAEDKGTEGRRGGCREGSEEDARGTAAGAKRKSKDARGCRHSARGAGTCALL